MIPSCFYSVFTDAIDKGDNRRLGKKPVFTSSQVILLLFSTVFDLKFYFWNKCEKALHFICFPELRFLPQRNPFEFV